MGKVIRLTESDLRNFIKAKVQEALEHNVDLGYKPAIGNKKRKPGDEIEDQMTKRRNTKLDERSIYRKGPDGEPDYEGEDGDSGNKTVTVELDEQDYAIAFKQVVGREPREEDFENLPIDVQVKVNINTTQTRGDYDTPGTSECDITGWEITDPSCGALDEKEMEVVRAAVGVHLEACDPSEL